MTLLKPLINLPTLIISLETILIHLELDILIMKIEIILKGKWGTLNSIMKLSTDNKNDMMETMMYFYETEHSLTEKEKIFKD